jgi:2-phosphosulfolactate phosphatase
VRVVRFRSSAMYTVHSGETLIRGARYHSRVSEVVVQRGFAGLERLTGPVVVLDVFRASNTVIALLAGGAAEVQLVAELEQARRLKAVHPTWLLLGERGGVTLPGFDGGNSPHHAPRLLAPGDTVILTTSAGTQAVHRLTAAGPVLFASFANAAAVVAVLLRLAPTTVTLLPMGLEAREPAEEDDLAADYLASSLAGKPPCFVALRERLLASPGAGRLRRLGQVDDLEWCTRLDTVTLVPVVAPGDPPCARRLGDARPSKRD